jgi:hypothetical protein
LPGIFHTAKGDVCLAGSSVIDVRHTAFHVSQEFVDEMSIPSKQRSSEAVPRGIGNSKGLFGITHTNHGQYRAKDFIESKWRVRLNMIKECGGLEIALLLSVFDQ